MGVIDSYEHSNRMLKQMMEDLRQRGITAKDQIIFLFERLDGLPVTLNARVLSNGQQFRLRRRGVHLHFEVLESETAEAVAGA